MGQGAIHVYDTQLRADILSQFNKEKQRKKKSRRATQNNNEQLQYRVYDFPSEFAAHIDMHIMRAHTHIHRHIIQCTT